MARALYAESLFDGKEWHQDVSLEIDEQGNIAALKPGRIENALFAAGPVIPGMINCHSHAFQRAFAGLTEWNTGAADSFWSWRELMYKLLATLTPEDVSAIARQLYIEMLKAGYTCVAEFHYLHHDTNAQPYADIALMSKAVIDAATDTGIGITHLPVLYHYAGFAEQPASKQQGRFINDLSRYIDIVEALDAVYANHNNVHIGVAAHSLRAVSETQLQQLLTQYQPTKSRPFHIHISEQLLEVEECIRAYGQRPVAWLLQNFELNRHCCLVHATHLDSSEVELMARQQVVAGLCLTTEANLGDGIFASPEYLAKNGVIAIGSDSHIAVNIADELRTLEYGHRLTCHQRAVLHTARQRHIGSRLYASSLAGGQQTVAQDCGQIAPGKQADLVVLDPHHPALIGKQQDYLLDSAIFAAASLPVHSVMVAGRWCVEQGQHPGQENALADFAGVMNKVMRLCA